MGRMLIVLLALVGCTQKGPEIGSAKLFALTPHDFVRVPMRLTGSVVGVGPAGSYFILEDDSGKMLVSAHRLQDSFSCPVGSRASLEGRLEKLESEKSYYFAMEKLTECTR